MPGRFGLRRHPKHEPVVACPPSRFYLLRKTVRRHKMGFAAAAAVMIVLAAGVLISSLEAVRARRAELQTRHTGYVADMDLANRALNEGDLGIARTHLRRYWPEPRETDLRNWEWRYLANLSDGDAHASLVVHSASVLSLCFLGDDTLLTCGTTDWRTVLWSLRERRPASIITNKLSFGGGISEITAVAPKRKALFYRDRWHASTDVKLMDLQRGTETNLLDAKAVVKSLDISPDEKVLAVASANQVGIWDLDGKTWLKPFETESGAATQGLFSPNSHSLATAARNGEVKLWSVDEPPSAPEPVSFPPSEYFELAADGSGFGRILHPGGSDGVALPWTGEVWTTTPLQRTMTVPLPAAQTLWACAFSPDHRSLATAVPDGGTFLWDLATHRRTMLTSALTPYQSLSFSPDGSRLAAGSKGESKLFDVATGQAVLSFKQHGLKLAFARDGERLLAVHSEGASVFHAPSFEKLQFGWLKEKPSQEAPPYLGPMPDYTRPGKTGPTSIAPPRRPCAAFSLTALEVSRRGGTAAARNDLILLR